MRDKRDPGTIDMFPDDVAEANEDCELGAKQSGNKSALDAASAGGLDRS